MKTDILAMVAIGAATFAAIHFFKSKGQMANPDFSRIMQSNAYGQKNANNPFINDGTFLPSLPSGITYT